MLFVFERKKSKFPACDTSQDSKWNFPSLSEPIRITMPWRNVTDCSCTFPNVTPQHSKATPI